MDEKTRSKLKTLHVTIGVLVTLVFLSITIQPFVGMFDRNDIWVGIMPLNQFWIIASSMIIAVLLGVHYYFERSILKKGVRK
ncbi:MAG: hypothetical protein JW760_13505 [Spirochaetales bacterium]|nr:hypothetical protein [Spirochaetales bacterium]